MIQPAPPAGGPHRAEKWTVAAAGERLGAMRRAVLCALLGSLALGGPAPAEAASGRRTAARSSRAAAPKKGPGSPGRVHRPPTLAQAKEVLASVKRSPQKRRYRHHWERAIRALLASARGRDRPEALLEAARARYALYRWSAWESDRDKALLLADRARRAGSRPAASFASAVRREAGDEAAHSRSARRRPAVPTSAARGPPAEDEDHRDPILEEAVAEPAGAPGGGGGPVQVSEVKAWSGSGYTRVVVYLSEHVEHEKVELEAAGGMPRRLAIDFTPAFLSGGARAQPVGGARVERVRAAQHDPDTVRVVLDLAGRDAYAVFRLDDPPRLIVDVGARPADDAAEADRSPAAADGAPPDGGAGEADGGPRRVRRVVVDAGHGGQDSGAIGPHGVREKDVTLSIARRLARRLEAAGFEVVLTRRDDRTLALEERTAIANAARGDLFVSLHANAHPRRDRRGVETYYLNVTDDRYAARLAARENGTPHEEIPGPQVLRILSDLDAKASARTSQRLAALVQRELTAGIRERVGDVRDLGVKSALFYVLLGARMPAVLVEASFISNRVEERRLASRGFQEEVASSLAGAISQFARGEARVARAP